MKFLTALAAKAVSCGAKIFEETEVLDIKKDNGTWLVKTKTNSIRTREVVVATYEPWRAPWHLYFKKALYRSYVLELETLVGKFADGLYEDMTHPYHYSKIDNLVDRCRIIFGGEDHREDIKISRAKNYRALKNHFPIFLGEENIKLKRQWSGQILESVDGLPYIGRDKNSGLHYAFAFSGNGLTYSIIAAALLTESIVGEKGPMSFCQNTYKVNRWPRLKALFIKGRDYALTLLGGAVKNFFCYNHCR